MKKVATTIGLFALLTALATGALALAASVPSGDKPPPPAQMQLGSGSNFTFSDAESFTEFSLYALDSEFQGFALTDMLRRDDSYDQVALEESPGSDYVSFLYGTCVPEDQVGCPVPVEVQVWPCLSRPFLSIGEPATVEGADVSVAPDESLTIRGVEAFFFDDWTRLEFSTWDVIVVLFGADRNQLLDAANALQGVNTDLEPEDPFLQPNCW